MTITRLRSQKVSSLGTLYSHDLLSGSSMSRDSISSDWKIQTRHNDTFEGIFQSISSGFSNPNLERSVFQSEDLARAKGFSNNYP